ncbi:GNAT family N-acetyltransferase [Daejeonella sp.]|jgi:N-acetylglutamate synthase-like GNAT family acetyltransferase|uniref:GNAT family N-acetyltransferase n=1 Tax=Daejeonella sp. TaxID=2805397 RepID=UPI0037BE3383
MKIRIATKLDIPVISDLAEKTWWPSYSQIISDEQISFMLQDMYSAESLLEQMNAGIEFLILERENMALGFAAYSLVDAQNQVFKLHKLYVLPSEQGSGTGKKLIDEVSSSAKLKGGKILELNVNRGNSAQHFYKKMAFEIYQKLDINYHHFVLNDYVMRKEL